MSPPALGHTDRRGAPLFFEGQPQLPVGDDGNINFVFGSQAPGGLDPSEFPSGSAHEPRSLERELLLFPAQWIPASNLLCSSLAAVPSSALVTGCSGSCFLLRPMTPLLPRGSSKVRRLGPRRPTTTTIESLELKGVFKRRFEPKR